MPLPNPILSTTLAGIPLRAPILLAAGTAGTLDEMADVLDLSRIGAIVTKSITRQPREGNPTWRILPTDAGMLNAIGLANVGLTAFIKDYAPRIPSVPCPVFASIAGFSIDDYVQSAAALNAIASIPALELNVSCPNVHNGCEFSADPAMLSDLLRAVRPVVTKRLFVKLSPINGRPSIIDIARVAIDAGADALCISNTLPAMAIDVETKKPRLANTTGGLSGPALHPVALKLVHDVYRKVARDSKTPIIGIGGILSWHHAAEFILAGASTIEIGTALFANPHTPIKVAAGLAKWAVRQGVPNISALTGQLQLPH